MSQARTDQQQQQQQHTVIQSSSPPSYSDIAKYLIQDDQDIEYEDAVYHNKYELRHWWNYIQHKQNTILSQVDLTTTTTTTITNTTNPTHNNNTIHMLNSVYVLYERALSHLPFSYKLWYHYIQLKLSHEQYWIQQHINNNNDNNNNNNDGKKSTTTTTTIMTMMIPHLFNKSLEYMYQYPRIWIDYLQYMMKRFELKSIVIQLFNQCLLSLPVSQHERIWTCLFNYLSKQIQQQSSNHHDFVHRYKSTIQSLYHRYLHFNNNYSKQYLHFLLNHQFYQDAFDFLLLNMRRQQQQQQQQPKNKQQQQWNESEWMNHMIQIIPHLSLLDDSTHKNEFNIEQVIQHGIQQHPSLHIELYSTWVHCYINNGRFESAFNVLENVMNNHVSTIKDYNQLFDQYSSLLDELMSHCMQSLNRKDHDNEDDNEDDNENDDSGDNNNNKSEHQMDHQLLSVQLEMYIAKYEYLMQRRPFLSNAVLLRQNPHHVSNWHKRIQLYIKYLHSQQEQQEVTAAHVDKKTLDDEENDEQNEEHVESNDNDDTAQQHQKKTRTSESSPLDATVDGQQQQQQLYLIPVNDQTIVDTFTAAIESVDASKAVGGRPFTLYTSFARYYLYRFKDLESCRTIFEKAIESNAQFYSTDDMAQLWCEYIEMELRINNVQGAYELIQRVLFNSTTTTNSNNNTTGNRWLRRHVKLWNLYLDIQESLFQFEKRKSSKEKQQQQLHKDKQKNEKTVVGTNDSQMEEQYAMNQVIEIYDRMIQLKIATPITILNYANFLWQNQYYEMTFQAYEKGIQLFQNKYPQVHHIWVQYLNRFMQRFLLSNQKHSSTSATTSLLLNSNNRKLERIRDLFEQSLSQAPVDYAKPLYILYAQMEEEYGLLRHAMGVYERATQALISNKNQSSPTAAQDVYDMYMLYIFKAAQYYGLSRARNIYEQAIGHLDMFAQSTSTRPVRDLCLKYAELERKLGEIDRARSILAHCSKYCDPRSDKEFWQVWTQFEKNHGNIDTFKEMLRIKRSVEAHSSQGVNIMTSGMVAAQQEREKQDEELQRQKMKRRREEQGGAITSSDIERLRQSTYNPDEVDI